MHKKVILGTFNAEQYWRDESLATLPCLRDFEGERIVSAMDELLFPCCDPGDVLITRYKVDEAWQDYLRKFGFSFKNNNQDVDSNGDTEGKCIFQLLSESPEKEYYAQLMQGVSLLLPYAVLPFSQQLAQQFGLIHDAPSIEIVRKVNSKIYTHTVAAEINLGYHGQVLYNTIDLQPMGIGLLEKHKAFLIKDLYGASGKGNLLVNSEGILHRLITHLGKQEAIGKKICFVLEPLWDKAVDFSCNANILADGAFQVVSIQKMMNQSFGYLGSSLAEPQFMDDLHQRGYLEHIGRIANQLHQDGYWGPVEIDSMILQNEAMIPLVGLNARLSLGIIHRYLNNALGLTDQGLQSQLTFIATGYAGALTFAQLLEKMAEEHLLYQPGEGEGVIPLSANTLFINQAIPGDHPSSKIHHGRLYLGVVAKEPEQWVALLERMKQLLRSLLFKIYN